MTGAFGIAGYYFGTSTHCSLMEISAQQLTTFSSGRKPTSASSEAAVSMAEGSMPWQVGSAKGKQADEHFKYQYHPGGDPKKAPKDAPSALNVVIVPNVTLRKVSLRTGRIDWDMSFEKSTNYSLK